MSSQSEASRQRAVAYLKRSLQLNPLFESEKIVRYRAKALGLSKSKNKMASAVDTNKRTRLITSLDKVRDGCWTEPVGPLMTSLQSLQLEDHPDLQRRADRLRVILSNRCHLPELAGHRHFDEKFLSCFKQILTLPPKELAIPREQVIASFRNRKLRGKGLKMIRLMEKRVPELCRLEQEWLESLKRQKVNKAVASQAETYQSSSSESSGISGWAVWVIIVIVIRILASIARQ